jgi:hypothetical protein
VPTVPLNQLKPNPWNRDVNLDIPVALSIPPATPTGVYQIQVSFFTEFWDTLKVYAPTGEQNSSVTVASVVIATPDAISGNNQPSRSIDLALGDSIDLLGVDPPQVSSDGLVIDLYWRARKLVDVNYTVFLQLLDAHGILVAQSDSYPLDGDYPTSAWLLGQVVRDRHRLSWPAGRLTGRYRLITGMYRVETMTRLPVSGEAVERGEDYVVLDTIEFPVSSTHLPPARRGV